MRLLGVLLLAFVNAACRDAPTRSSSAPFYASDVVAVTAAEDGAVSVAAAGTTVAAIRWRTGEVLWSTPTVRNAGHVAYLPPGRILVLGHRSPDLAVLDAATGAGWLRARRGAGPF